MGFCLGLELIVLNSRDHPEVHKDDLIKSLISPVGLG